MNGIKLRGTGRCVPANTVTNDDLSRLVDTNDEWITARTGIRSRYRCEKETLTELCVSAARDALHMAGITPADIGVCIVATVSADTVVPSAACLLQRALGLPEDTPCFDLNAACTGFVYALHTMECLLNASPRKFGLVVGAEALSKVVDWMQPAFAKIAELEIRPSQIPAHSMEISDAMNEILTKKWSELRGISVVSVAFNPVTIKDEDAEAIKQAQNTAMYTDPSMMAATLGMAQAEAMKSAAGNPNGAMMGFMGMNMASGMNGGANLQGLYNQGAEKRQQEEQARQMAAQEQSAQQQTGSWTCSCGTLNEGKFCMNCGSPKPQAPENWICSCGAVNHGKFCTNCGKPFA